MPWEGVEKLFRNHHFCHSEHSEESLPPYRRDAEAKPKHDNKGLFQHSRYGEKALPLREDRHSPKRHGGEQHQTEHENQIGLTGC